MYSTDWQSFPIISSKVIHTTSNCNIYRYQETHIGVRVQTTALTVKGTTVTSTLCCNFGRTPASHHCTWTEAHLLVSMLIILFWGVVFVGCNVVWSHRWMSKFREKCCFDLQPKQYVTPKRRYLIYKSTQPRRTSSRSAP